MPKVGWERVKRGLNSEKPCRSPREIFLWSWETSPFMALVGVYFVVSIWNWRKLYSGVFHFFHTVYIKFYMVWVTMFLGKGNHNLNSVKHKKKKQKWAESGNAAIARVYRGIRSQTVKRNNYDEMKNASNFYPANSQLLIHTVLYIPNLFDLFFRVLHI